MAAPTIWSEQPPDSVFDHIVEVLLFGEVVETGRRYRRRWLLGNRDIDETSQMVTGQIGWEATGTEAKDKYDPERHEWVDAVGERGRSGRAPFAFDAVTRTLGVLKHPSFDEKTLPGVFGELLRRGERARISASTDWDVEPIGDTATFREWLLAADFVEQVRFVAKRPNPDALDEFGPVWERMKQHRAGLIREIMEAEKGREVGLVNLEDDDVVGAYLAMSENAFGYVTARGVRDGRQTRYDQRSQVARRQTEELPSSWSEVLGVVIGFVRERRRQQRGV